MPRKPPGKVTLPRLERARIMRERGMSYPAISVAIDVYEGSAPGPHHLRKLLVATGTPKRPRGVPLRGNLR